MLTLTVARPTAAAHACHIIIIINDIIVCSALRPEPEADKNQTYARLDGNGGGEGAGDCAASKRVCCTVTINECVIH